LPTLPRVEPTENIRDKILLENRQPRVCELEIYPKHCYDFLLMLFNAYAKQSLWPRNEKSHNAMGSDDYPLNRFSLRNVLRDFAHEDLGASITNNFYLIDEVQFQNLL